jgi:hypothetical protein
MTVPNAPGWNGRWRMSPRITETSPTRARRIRLRPRASMASDRSMPTTWTAPVFASGTVTRPVPQPSSRTRPPRPVTSRCQNGMSRRPNVRAFSQS